MRSYIPVRIALLLTAMFILTLSSVAQEKKITSKNVPRPVLDAFKASYPNATIKGYAREIEEGKTYFEIESVEGKTARDILYNPDGTVAEIEETVSPDDLPATVRDAVQREHPKAVITKAEKITKDGTTAYEVIGRVGKKRFTMEFDADGKVIKKGP